MRAFDVISLLAPQVLPGNTKIHLATKDEKVDPKDEKEDPLAVYLKGGFDEWQRSQTRRNFERTFVLSLIEMRTANHWLFAGVYESRGSTGQKGQYHYDLVELPACTELNGRLTARFERSARQAYLDAENWADRIELASIMPERMRIAEFPGFKAVHLTKDELDTIVRQDIESWRAALSSVGGVYLISDTNTGRLYVGSATGAGGIWQRWCEYAATGHGGNQELMRLVREEGIGRALAFRFAILEVADTHTSDANLLQREAHWKRVLLSRSHGNNR